MTHLLARLRYRRRTTLTVSFLATLSLPAHAAGDAPLPGTPLPAGAVAPAGGVDIRWEAPPECPGDDEVKLTTERFLGQPLQTPRAQQVSARAKVRRNEGGKWELTLTLTSNDRTSNETLVATRCRALADATALQVALATDPVAVVDAMMVAPDPRPEPTPVAPGQDAATASSPDAKKSVITLRMQGGADLATFGTGAPGAAGFLGWERSGWRIELGGEGFWGARAKYANLPTVGAYVQLFAGALRACALPRAGSFTFPMCAGFEAGAMRAEGYGLENSFTATSPWAALVVGPAVRMNIDRGVALWVGVDGLMPVVRSGFNVRNLDTLYTAPRGGSRAWAGMELRLFR